MPVKGSDQKTDDLIVFTKDDIDLIRRTKMPEGSNEDDLQLLLYYARKTGLNPLLNQVYPSKRKGKITPQATIDGFRLAAERTGQYLGQTTPMFCGSDGVWTDAWVSDAPPVLAKVGILRRGFKEPIYGIARYSAYMQKDRDGRVMETWSKMSDTMLAKTAEALAYRKAFPNILSGLYTPEEMSHLDVAGEEEPEGPNTGAPQAGAQPASATPLTEKAPTKQGSDQLAPSAGAVPAAAKPGEGGITEEQVKKLWEIARSLDLNVANLTTKCNEILDTTIATPRALNEEQADIVIKELERRLAEAEAAKERQPAAS